MLKLRPMIVLALLLAVTLVCALPAAADTLSGCPSCNGGSYSLTVNPVPVPDSDPNTEIFQFVWSMDVTGFNAAPAGTTIYVKAIGLKPSNDIMDPSNVVEYYKNGIQVAPANGPVSSYWSDPMVTGTLNANACRDNNGDAFACTESTALASWNSFVVGSSTTFSWVINVRMANGTLFTESASIKAEFVDANGEKVGALLSDSTRLTETPPPPIPEPASLILLGSGLAGVATARRRKRS